MTEEKARERVLEALADGRALTESGIRNLVSVPDQDAVLLAAFDLIKEGVARSRRERDPNIPRFTREVIYLVPTDGPDVVRQFNLAAQPTGYNIIPQGSDRAAVRVYVDGSIGWTGMQTDSAKHLSYFIDALAKAVELSRLTPP